MLSLDVLQMVEQYREGVSSEQLGPMHGCDPQTVRRRLRKAGVRIRTEDKGGDSRRLDLDVEAMVLARAAGHTYKQIAQRHHVDPCTVRNRLREWEALHGG